MIPSIGRVVRYHAYGTPGGEFPTTQRAAIIIEVLALESLPEQYKVKLCVLNPTGIFFSDWLTQGGAPGCWQWPARD